MNYFKDENVRKKIFIGAFLILLFFFFYYLGSIWTAITSFVKVIVPFIVGAAIAFVLNVPMRWVEKGKVETLLTYDDWKVVWRKIQNVI